MKNLLLLPLLGAAALLSGCAVDAGYVDGGPRRVYAPEPAYYGDGGTTIVVDRGGYSDRGHYDRGDYGSRSRYRTSEYHRQGGERGNVRRTAAAYGRGHGQQTSRMGGGNHGNNHGANRMVNTGNNRGQARNQNVKKGHGEEQKHQ